MPRVPSSRKGGFKDQHIPRPPNSFILFRADLARKRRFAKSAQAGKQVVGHISKDAGRIWHTLPAHERQFWEDAAKTAKEEHTRLHPDYKFEHKAKQSSPLERASGSSRRRTREVIDVETGKRLWISECCVLWSDFLPSSSVTFTSESPGTQPDDITPPPQDLVGDGTWLDRKPTLHFPVSTSGTNYRGFMHPPKVEDPYNDSGTFTGVDFRLANGADSGSYFVQNPNAQPAASEWSVSSDVPQGQPQLLANMWPPYDMPRDQPAFTGEQCYPALHAESSSYSTVQSQHTTYPAGFFDALNLGDYTP